MSGKNKLLISLSLFSLVLGACAPTFNISSQDAVIAVNAKETDPKRIKEFLSKVSTRKVTHQSGSKIDSFYLDLQRPTAEELEKLEQLIVSEFQSEIDSGKIGVVVVLPDISYSFGETETSPELFTFRGAVEYEN